MDILFLKGLVLKNLIGDFFECCFENIDGANLKNVLMVGDRIESDINGAKNFGIDSCYFDRKGTMNGKFATYTISNLTDLLKIV